MGGMAWVGVTDGPAGASCCSYRPIAGKQRIGDPLAFRPNRFLCREPDVGGDCALYMVLKASLIPWNGFQSGLFASFPRAKTLTERTSAPIRPRFLEMDMI